MYGRNSNREHGESRCPYLAGFLFSPKECGHRRVIRLAVRDSHRDGVQLLWIKLRVVAIDVEEGERTSETGSLVPVRKSLAPSEAHQVSSGKIGDVRFGIVGPTLDRARQGGQHNVGVDYPVLAAKSFNLSCVHCKKSRLGNPSRLFRDSPRHLFRELPED